MNTKVPASNKDLFDEVVSAGLCTYCGACSQACPYLLAYQGRIVLLDNCTCAEGQCYQYCPRTYLDLDALSRHIFGAPYSEQALGTVQQVVIARSTEERVRQQAQYGGVVITLLLQALTEHLIDSAILTKMSDDKIPSPYRASTPEEILRCAGTNHMACPVLSAVNSLPNDSKERFAVVTTPCQGLALAKMKRDQPRHRVDTNNIKFTIGLFCTWALSPREFHSFLCSNLDLHQVTKFEIPPPPASRFEAHTPSGVVSLALEEVRKFIMPGCAYCHDMTSEFADLSVGSAEGLDGWNTVIVRTNVGAELLHTAVTAGKLEIASLPSENLTHLEDAALLKKRRALTRIIKNAGDKADLGYFGLSASTSERLLS